MLVNLSPCIEIIIKRLKRKYRPVLNVNIFGLNQYIYHLENIINKLTYMAVNVSINGKPLIQ